MSGISELCVGFFSLIDLIDCLLVMLGVFGVCVWYRWGLYFFFIWEGGAVRGEQD
ncbi:unnamed protein product [Tuber melanosporum]|jgi:hypothetical protein|uniref:(Perigord truffle) hypothetical protein n=1 Tax=Tuber melanosporum (strain Mel28) TaxID=656061 RepID=D5GA22_TUBMM|nr:uncharacterized protein GSTUM_00003505001 [Tuber melanosporum]CAZ81365.1 unnamed protein product [Tuber melanosporum]